MTALITLRYQYTVEDYLKALRLHMRLRPWQRQWLMVVAGLSFIRVFPLILVGAPLIKQIRAIMPLICFSVLYILIYLVFPISSIRHRYARRESLRHTYETVIGPDTITTTSELGHRTVALADCYQYKLGRDCVLLYTSSELYKLFPRRFFSTDRDFHTFIFYLEDHLGQPVL
ncbi:MAG: hypothetical protein AAF821_24990 [Cyanobacteria bacterium P01_D01_bin.156]